MKRRYLVIMTVLLLGMAAYSLAADYLHARRVHQLITELNQPYADIPSLLKNVDELDLPAQVWVLDQSRYSVQHYYESRAEAMVGEAKDNHNFDAALAELGEATPYYPDSAELQQERLSLQMRKAKFVSKSASDRPQ